MAAQIAGFGEWQGVIISLFSYANLFTLGLLGMSGSLASVAEPEVAVTLLPTESDAEIMAKVRSLMAIRKSYLDPNLTLSQIARRLRRPAKVVSAAINRNRGENVSRYITAYRVNHAANLLIAVETATQAMLAAGFNTKSSFNREYLRVQGVSPACWLATQHNVGKSASYRR